MNELASKDGELSERYARFFAEPPRLMVFGREFGFHPF
jgi:hypothetical protein